MPLGGGRGNAPVNRKEDRDLQHFANRKVATQGPPTLLTSSRGSGRGRSGPPGVGRGRARGGQPVPTGLSRSRPDSLRRAGAPPSSRTANDDIRLYQPASSTPNAYASGSTRGGISSSTSRSIHSLPDRPRADRYIPPSRPPSSLAEESYHNDRYPAESERRHSPPSYRHGDREWEKDRIRQEDSDRIDDRDRTRQGDSMWDRDSTRQGNIYSPSPYSDSGHGRRYSPSQPVFEDTWSPRLGPGPGQLQEGTYFDNGTRDSRGRFEPSPLPPKPSITHPASSPPPPSTSSLFTPVELVDIKPNINAHSKAPVTHGQHIVFGSTPPMPEPPLSGPSRQSQLSASAIPPHSALSRPSPAVSTSLAPRWATDSQAGPSSSPAPPASSTTPNDIDTSVPTSTEAGEVKKLKFKPKVPGKKEKGKQREEVQIKLEPDLNTGGYANVPFGTEKSDGLANDRNTDMLMEDVKPDISAIEEEAMNIQDADWVQQEGVLGISKRDLSANCFSKDLEKRKRTRDKLKTAKMKALKEQGRTIVRTHWRDDGVAFDWKLNTATVEDYADDDIVEITPNDRSAIRVAEPSHRTVENHASRTSTIPSKFGAADKALDERSESSFTHACTPINIGESSTRTRDSVGIDMASSNSHISAKLPANALYYQELENGYSYLVEIPSEFSTPQRRKQSSERYMAWKDEQIRLAAQWDETGKPENRVLFTPPGDSRSTIKLQIFRFDANDPATWPDHLFQYEKMISFPIEWQSPRDRAGAESQVKEWILNYCDRISEPDDQGRPTRWVRADRRIKSVIFRWKPKTRAEIEAYQGPAIALGEENGWAFNSPTKQTKPTDAKQPESAQRKANRKPSALDLVNDLVAPAQAVDIARDHTGMTFLISYPDQFTVSERRDGAAFSLWKQEQIRTASLPDLLGRPTYRVTCRMTTTEGAMPALSFRILPYSPDDPSTWPSESFDHEIVIDYPAAWHNAIVRHKEKQQFEEWIQTQVDSERVSPRDEFGRVKTWVKMMKKSTSLELRWREKTKEELASGRGQVIGRPADVNGRHEARSTKSQRSIDASSMAKAKPTDVPATSEKLQMNDAAPLETQGIVPSQLLKPASFVFDHEEVVAFPARWENTRDRLQDEEGVREWIRNQVALCSAPDKGGKPTRWTKVLRRSKDILIRWRAKTEEEMGGGAAAGAQAIGIHSKFTSTTPRKGSSSKSSMAPKASTSSIAVDATPLRTKKSKKRSRVEEDHSSITTPSKDEAKPAKVRKSRKASAVEVVAPVDPPPASKLQAGSSNDAYVGTSLNTASTSWKPSSTPTSAPAPLAASKSTALMTPEPTSPHLDALNASLRQKVAEIERWTRLKTEFPDLATALDEQVLRTQGEIFGLHDTIREEKERLRG